MDQGDEESGEAKPSRGKASRDAAKAAVGARVDAAKGAAKTAGARADAAKGSAAARADAAKVAAKGAAKKAADKIQGKPELYGDSWHWASWGVLGNIETVLKLIGWTFGLAAAVVAADYHDPAPSKVPKTQKAAGAIGIIFSFLVLLGIPDRIKLKDIGAMILIILNNIGHWALSIALLIHPKILSPLVYLFCAFVLAGDLVKVVFFYRELGKSFTVPGMPPAVLWGVLVAFIAAYILIIALTIATDAN